MDKIDKIVEELRKIKQSDGRDFMIDLRITYSSKGVKVNLTDQTGGSASMKKPMTNLSSAITKVLEDKIDSANHTIKHSYLYETLESAVRTTSFPDDNAEQWNANRIKNLNVKINCMNELYPRMIAVYNKCLNII